MPLYDFLCKTCKVTEERNVPSDRRDIQTCPICGQPLTRKLSMPRIKIGPTSDQATADLLGMSEKDLPKGLKT